MATLYDDEGNEFQIDDALLQPGGQQDRGPQTNSDFAALRKQTQATKHAEKAAQDAKREAAFLRAGIDPEAKGIASYFVKGYEGDLTADAIKAAAMEAGVLQAPVATPEQQAEAQAQAEALAASQRVAGAANAGMAAPQGADVDRAAMEQAYAAGGIEALTDVLQSKGIPRVTL